VKRPKKTKSNREPWWFTKSQAAGVTGYSVRQFTDKIQPRLDSTATRGRGADLRFDIRAVGRALVTYVADLNRPKPEDIDPLLGGEGEEGDALEAYRREATTKLRLANAATRTELVDRRIVLDAMSKAFGTAANCGKKLARKFGNDAVEIWNEGIDAMRDAAIKELSDDSDEANREKLDQ
jgi:hypothetical protein